MKRKRNYKRHCTTCTHPDKHRMEVLIAGGASIRSVARKFGLKNPHVLYRHWANHCSPSHKRYLLLGDCVSEELKARVADENASVLDMLKYNRAILLETVASAREAGDRNGIAVLMGRINETLQLTAKITGELAQSPLIQNNTTNIQNNLILTQQVVTLQAELLRVLARHPDARADVAAVFHKFEKLSPPPVEVENGTVRSAA